MLSKPWLDSYPLVFRTTLTSRNTTHSVRFWRSRSKRTQHAR